MMRKTLFVIITSFHLLPSLGMAAGDNHKNESGQLLALINARVKATPLEELKNTMKMREQNAIIEGGILYQISFDSFMGGAVSKLWSSEDYALFSHTFDPLPGFAVVLIF